MMNKPMNSLRTEANLSLRVLLLQKAAEAESIVEILKRDGFQVVFKQVERMDGLEEALTSGEVWDLILSEYELPGLQALDALNALKKSGRDIPFIIVSRFSDEAAINQALLAGAQDFISNENISRLGPVVFREFSQLKNRKKLKESEQSLLPAFENAAVGLAQISLDGKWIRLNQWYCEILGYTEEELMHLTFEDITHAEDLEKDSEAIEQLLAGCVDSCFFEKRYIRKDGTTIWVNILVSLVWDELKKPLYYIAVVEDISEKKKAEERLQRTIERERFASEIIDSIRAQTDLNTILHKAVCGIGRIAQADRCIIWLYDAETRQFQMPGPEREYLRNYNIMPIGEVLPILVAGEEGQVSGNTLALLDETGHALQFNKLLNIPDVSQLAAISETSQQLLRQRSIKSLLQVPIIYNDQFLGIIRLQSVLEKRTWDPEIIFLVELIGARLAVAISHAKVLGDLKNSEVRKSAILNSSLDAIITINQAGKVLEWNKSAENILGYTRDDAIGQDLVQLIIPEQHRNKYDDGLANYLITGLEGALLNKPIEMPACRADGSEFTCEIAITRVSVSGEPIFTAILRDITERKQAEHDLKIYAARLEESNKSLEQFAMVASHDLQTPLRKIYMFSTYLQESASDKLTDEEKDYIGRIHQAVQRMQRLINDLLDLSRVNRKGKPFVLTDLDSIANEVASDLQPLLNETGGRIEVQEMLAAEVDSTQMRSLIFNLVENALKFRKPDEPPIVKIGAYPIQNTNQYEIVVSDNGIGIQEEYRQKVFEIFTRLNANYSGTGIGLALCKKITERHGGSISVDSQVNVGSTFRIRLPFHPTPIVEEELKVEVPALDAT